MFFKSMSPRILVMEDNYGDFILIQEYLKEEVNNSFLVHAQTFNQAQEILLHQNDFDVILLDLSLPDNKGEQLVHDTVHLAKHIPVIVLTGYDNKNFGIRTLSLGVSDYLLKDELSSSVLIKSIAYGIERKKIHNQLQEAEEQRKKHDLQITKAIISAQEKERMEIGSELHDNVNQLLLASKMNLRLAKDAPDKEKALEWIENTNTYLNLAIDEIRNLSHLLTPRSFLRNSMYEAFDDLLKNLNVENKYKISFIFNKFDERQLQDDLKLNLYRILQEQTKNIMQYSNAQLIEINVTLQNGILKMKIYDDGKGFDLENEKKGLGLSNIRQRAELFNGSVFIRSAVGEGCELLVEIPIEKDVPYK